MLNRVEPTASLKMALNTREISLLAQLVKNKSNNGGKSKCLSDYLIKIAMLGGYWARKNDFPPGGTS